LCASWGDKQSKTWPVRRQSDALDDDALLTIAENLARLKLSPLLHLKIAVAVVAPLITPTSEASTSTAQGEKAVEPTRSKESPQDRKSA